TSGSRGSSISITTIVRSRRRRCGRCWSRNASCDGARAALIEASCDDSPRGRCTGQSGLPWSKPRRIALAAPAAPAAPPHGPPAPPPAGQVRPSRGGVCPNGWLPPPRAPALALAMHAIAATASLAQQWPTHPVRFVLPFGPGSGADTAARLIADKLQQKWGQPVIIDGKPGGDGLLSLGAVVSAKDDHTLFFGPSSIFFV